MLKRTEVSASQDTLVSTVFHITIFNHNLSCTVLYSNNNESEKSKKVINNVMDVKFWNPETLVLSKTVLIRNKMLNLTVFRGSSLHYSMSNSLKFLYVTYMNSKDL